MNKKSGGECIATRELLFCLKGKKERRKFVVRIVGPYLVDKDKVDFKFDKGTAGCTIEFDGLDEDSIKVFGIDGIHALSLSVDIDPYLRSMIARYDFYWATGEPYFDE